MEEKYVEKLFSFQIIFALRAELFEQLDEEKLAGLSKLHSKCSEEHF